MSPKSIIWGIIGIGVALFGFLFSDETKYPVMAKFSGVMIVAGVATASLALATKWNPFKTA